jgi:hypothetical protein
MFAETFSKLSGAFTDAIQAVQGESGSGIGTVGKALIARLEELRSEVDGWRQGQGVKGAEKGEQNDQVERIEGQSGLYRD